MGSDTAVLLFLYFYHRELVEGGFSVTDDERAIYNEAVEVIKSTGHTIVKEMIRLGEVKK